ncbi:MAG TPA: hypothetical protein VF051_02995, partial [Hyphomicrobiaceae bacterium]
MNRAAADLKHASPVAILYAGRDAALDELASALESERIEVRGLETVAPPASVSSLASVLLLSRLADLPRELPDHVIVVASDDAVAAAAGSRVMLTLPQKNSEAKLRVLRAAYQLAAARINAQRAERELARTRNELNQLHRIGMALMTERDPDKLLVRILEQARSLTHSDAGSLYLVEKDEADGKRLR